MCVCVCVVVRSWMYAWGCFCMHVWKLEIEFRYLPLLLPTLVSESGSQQIWVYRRMLQSANSVGVLEIWTQSLIFMQQVLRPLSLSPSPRLGLMKFISGTICLVTLCFPTTLGVLRRYLWSVPPECQRLCGRCHNYFPSPMLGSPFSAVNFLIPLGFLSTRH